jgi:hypothetical protein
MSTLTIMLGVAGGIALVSCLGIGGCIALIGMGAKGIAEKQEQERQQSVEEKKTPIVVSPSELLAEYKANEVAADLKYKGRWLRLQGEVDKIAKDIADRIYVTLKSGGRFELLSVQCHFDDKFTAQAAQLTKGQTITVVGKCDGKFGNVHLKDCEFVPDQEVARSPAPAGGGPQERRPTEPSKARADEKVRWDNVGNTGRVGDVSIECLQARSDSYSAKDLLEWRIYGPHLIVEMKLKNTSPTKVVNFRGWQDATTVIEDEHGNRYGLIDFGIGFGGFGQGLWTNWQKEPSVNAKNH